MLFGGVATDRWQLNQDTSGWGACVPAGLRGRPRLARPSLTSARLHSLWGQRRQIHDADRTLCLDTAAGESYDLAVPLSHSTEVPR
jgi:hypothetical protein